MSKTKSKTSTEKSTPNESFSDVNQTPVNPEQRHQMIAEAAYFLAEKRGFYGADVEQDWKKAEAEIDRVLQ